MAFGLAPTQNSSGLRLILLSIISWVADSVVDTSLISGIFSVDLSWSLFGLSIIFMKVLFAAELDPHFAFASSVGINSLSEPGAVKINHQVMLDHCLHEVLVWLMSVIFVVLDTLNQCI